MYLQFRLSYNPIGTTFRGNTTIRIFNEFRYFTGVRALTSNAFNGSYIQDINLVNIRTMNEAVFASSRVIYPWLPNLTTLDHASQAANGVFFNCKKIVAIRFDSLNQLGTLSYGSTASYLVITTSFVCSGTSNIAQGRTPSIVYVPDSLVASYKAAANWSEKTIRPISQIPTYHPACPWLDDLREKGFIS